MSSEPRFTECDLCVLKDTDAICCLVNRLSLALHNLAKELPVLRMFAADTKTCEWFSEQ